MIAYANDLSSRPRTMSYTYGAYSGPLPVELTSLAAKTQNGNVELNWETATELNNYGFEIQRASTKNPTSTSSATHFEKWEKVGFVKGSGTNNSIKLYSFTDKNPANGEYKYRLKQIDIDVHLNMETKWEQI